jgi:MerR family transcriptional regulator, light-induced transcriptional regulator
VTKGPAAAESEEGGVGQVPRKMAQAKSGNDVTRAGFTIRQVAELTGASEDALRAWERRFGFPRPARQAGGHRRYEPADVDRIRQALREREAGLSLEAALRRAAEAPEEADVTVFAALNRAQRLAPVRMVKARLDALTRAVEDEALARGAQPVLFGSFQRKAAFRKSQRHWQALAETARIVVVRADFDAPRSADGLFQVPIPEGDPASREWSVVCDAPGLGACVAGWELPGPAREEGKTEYEVLWTTEPFLVRGAARVAARRTAAVLPEAGESALEALSGDPAPLSELHSLVSLTSRIVAYLATAP